MFLPSYHISLSLSLTFFYTCSLAHSCTWLAVSLADRKSRVRDLSCSRRWWRLIRLLASPVAPDGATAGWMDTITHSQTGLTPLTASVFAVLFLISSRLLASACLPYFRLPLSHSAHVYVTVVVSLEKAGGRANSYICFFKKNKQKNNKTWRSVM